MIKKRYEVVLDSGTLSFETIQKLFTALFYLVRQGEVVTFSAELVGAALQFYLEIETRYKAKILPLKLPNLDDFSISPAPTPSEQTPNLKSYNNFSGFKFLNGHSLSEVIAKVDGFTALEISGRKIGTWGIFTENIYSETGRFLNLVPDFHNFEIDLKTSSNFLHREHTTHLKLEKSLQLFSSDQTNALLKIDPYPYFSGDYYLPFNSFDYMSHMLIIGATGSGKTKFLSHFIEQLARKDAYRVVVIDPHDALRSDIGGLPHTRVFDFSSAERSVNLFASNARDSVVNSEITLTLIKSVIGSQYNSKLERLARSSIYVLIEKGEFNFKNLKNFLVDSLYRNAVLSELSGYLPENIENFFGQDFNDLKTASYTEAFAPLISFVDELQLLPAFYRDFTNNLIYELSKNDITIFSLNQSRLGTKVQKIITGLILNQLFILMQQKTFAEHLTIVIDEVAVVEF